MPKKHTQSNKTRKRKGKDLDEIVEDLRPEKLAKLVNQPVDQDLPGDGQFYCVQCNRYFVNEKVMNEHKKTKVHKRRAKNLEDTPYTQKEADAAAGLGSYDRRIFLGSEPLNKKKAAHFDSGVVLDK